MAWSVPKIGTVATPASGNITLAEPAGIAAGDLMIACIGYRSNAAFTVPGDWNLIATQQSSGDTDATNGIASGLMMWCVRGGSAPTLTFNRTGGDVAQGRIIAYSGGHSSPFDAGTANTLAVASATVTTGTITTAQAGELIVAMVSAGDTLTTSAFDAATNPATASNGTDTTTAPTAGTWIERADTSTGTGADHGLAIADAIRSTAGATGTIQATVSASARHVMIAAAFKLAPANTTLVADAGSYSLSGNAATLRRTYRLVATAGTYGVIGNTATLSKGFRITADAGSYALAGNAVTFRRTYVLGATMGSYALTGNAATLKRGLRIAAEAGSYSLTGNVAGLAKGFRLTADAGSYALSGNATTLRRTYILGGSAGSYTLTGNTIATRWARRVAATAGVYTLTGNNATLSHSGGLTHYTLTALIGSYALSGNSVALRRTWRLPADADSYSLTGNAVGIVRTHILPTVQGAYSLTGNTVILEHGVPAEYTEPFYVTVGEGEPYLNINFGENEITMNTGINYLDTGEL